MNPTHSSAIWRFEVQPRSGQPDLLRAWLNAQIRQLGWRGVRCVSAGEVYYLAGRLTRQQAHRLARDLFCDAVTQHCLVERVGRNGFKRRRDSRAVTEFEIHHRPGVMDPIEESVKKAAQDMGLAGVTTVRTARRYAISPRLSGPRRRYLIEKVASNPLIQFAVSVGDPIAIETKPSPAETVNKVVPLTTAGAVDLMAISRKGQLSLNLDEMRAVQRHFRALKREPTECELETIAQTWSEHCYHKTFRAPIDYTEILTDGRTRRKRIRGLLDAFIKRATQRLNRPWCVSVFHDNAGVVAFDDEHHVCFKVETHNHPSALEPYGGASTGLGGVIRDVLGTGLGAKPVANTDVFAFAWPQRSFDAVPDGVLHPLRVVKGVVAGVRDYGNKMGIPTVNGAVIFEEDFLANPLVFCGTVGLLPAGCERKEVKDGDWVVVVGGRTGRDGIHGATFSSATLTQESEAVSSSAVQIGHPIQEKKVLDALMRARDKRLYRAITDCGAGGFSSAVGEMGKSLGVEVWLERVPLKYAGLTPTEIWISESQERMILAVPPERWRRFKIICDEEGVEATIIGRFVASGRLRVHHRDHCVVDLDMTFLHRRVPLKPRRAVWRQPRFKDPKPRRRRDWTGELHKVLSDGNVCSKSWIIRQYDHEVQGRSVIKPLGGPSGRAPADAAVLALKEGRSYGVAVGNGINVRYGRIDPAVMAGACLDEAVRQLVAVGADPDRIAVLDNFCWGDPRRPDRLGSLVRAAEGCYRYAVAYGTPFISGKDSLFNEFVLNGRSRPIPGTLLISAIGYVPDINRCVASALRRAGDALFIVGRTYDELGGGVYHRAVRGTLGASVPRPRPRRAMAVFHRMFEAIQRGCVAACHDCSDGGMITTAAEMAFGTGLGMTLDLRAMPADRSLREEARLFAESCSRFLVEVPAEREGEFLRVMKGVAVGRIGRVCDQPMLSVIGCGGQVCLRETIEALYASWESPFQQLDG